MERYRVYFKVAGFIFALGVAWASLNAKLNAHLAETADLLDVAKESCYAMHRHAGLDPSGCYEKSHRGRKF